MQNEQTYDSNNWCKGTMKNCWFQEISLIIVGVVAAGGVICDRVKEEGVEGVVNGFWDFLDEPSGKAERSTALEMTKGISPCAALSRDDKQKRGVQSFESTKENGENYFFYDFSGERCCS